MNKKIIIIFYVSMILYYLITFIIMKKALLLMITAFIMIIWINTTFATLSLDIMTKYEDYVYEFQNDYLKINDFKKLSYTAWNTDNEWTMIISYITINDETKDIVFTITELENLYNKLKEPVVVIPVIKDLNYYIDNKIQNKNKAKYSKSINKQLSKLPNDKIILLYNKIDKIMNDILNSDNTDLYKKNKLNLYYYIQKEVEFYKFENE